LGWRPPGPRYLCLHYLPLLHKNPEDRRWGKPAWTQHSPMLRQKADCFFWYRPTRVVPKQRPLNRCCSCYSNKNAKQVWQSSALHFGHNSYQRNIPQTVNVKRNNNKCADHLISQMSVFRRTVWTSVCRQQLVSTQHSHLGIIKPVIQITLLFKT